MGSVTKRIDNNHVKLDQLVPGSWEGLMAPFFASTAPLLKFIAPWRAITVQGEPPQLQDDHSLLQ
jgi:hypothetical protein